MTDVFASSGGLLGLEIRLAGLWSRVRRGTEPFWYARGGCARNSLGFSGKSTNSKLLSAKVVQVYEGEAATKKPSLCLALLGLGHDFIVVVNELLRYNMTFF